MTKYYYDDPLAAVWMVRHQGLRLVWEQGGDTYGQSSNGAAQQILYSMTWFVHNAPKSYYVHRDSFPLLQPQEGDLVELIRDGRVWCVGNYAEPWTPGETGPMVDTLVDGQYYVGDSTVRIIQRNGLAFHWPKVEVVA